MKTAITGANGQLGSRLVKIGAEPLSCNVLSREEAEAELRRVLPDVVIHLAAHTSVDWCEANEKEAMSVNVYGTALMCDVAANVLGEGRMVLISSDQVFDGLVGDYAENAEPNPINVYGKSKQAAEEVVSLYDNKVVRISRCFNYASRDILDYLNQLQSGARIYVPNFMYRSYCHIDFMARMLWEYAQRFEEMPPILHLAGATSHSFYEFMVKVAERLDWNPELVYPREPKEGYVARPYRTGMNTALACSLGFDPPFILQSIEKMNNERL